MQKGFDVVNLHGTASGVIATPYIGENNNWWIGNEDTGISAKGNKGDAGCSGIQGSKGDKGETGPVGPQGPKGEDADVAELEKLKEDVVRIDNDLAVLNTKSVPYAPDGQYTYRYITVHYTYQNNVVGVIPINIMEGKTLTVVSVQACLSSSSEYYDVTKNVISFERQNDYCIGIALELSNAYANSVLRVIFNVK